MTVSAGMEAGVDREVLLDRVGGDEELLREITKIFLDEYPALVEDIKAAVKDGDAIQLEHAAHSLKGSVSNFGAREATEAAFELECMGRNGKLTSAQFAVATLEYQFQLLRPQLFHLIS
ncbi:MAG: Hpt domain-containing protein [Bryobacteraceae bacterium]